MGHAHEHHHEHHHHEGGLKGRIIVGAVLLVGAVVAEHILSLTAWQALLLYLVPYLVVGYDVLSDALHGILHGEAFDEHLLMSIATIGAFAIGFLPNMEPQYMEGVAVMLFYQVGELFEHITEHRSHRAISHLMDIRPDKATVVRDGKPCEVHPAEVRLHETIIVRAGERIPLDGVVTEGTSSLDTRALTGESVPRTVKEGDLVLSGCVNGGGLLHVKVSKLYQESTVSHIISLVEHANERKSRSETFIHRFAKVYTPIVVVLAVVVAIVPPLLAASFTAAFPIWLGRALTFLVVSCPCALVISVPLTFFAGIGGASRQGILIKGSTFIERLSKAQTVVFDKTGTLTHGTFEVLAVHPDRIDQKALLHLAAHVERHSTHPIADALRRAYPQEADGCVVEQSKEIAGRGVQALVQGKEISVGNERMMETVGAKWIPCTHNGTIIHVAIEGDYVGHIVIADKIKENAAEAIATLKNNGVSHTVMLSGDRSDVAQHVAETIGVDECVADLLPQGKVDEILRIKSKMKSDESLLFVGDGINDAPVLATADVGVAMGALGSDAAIEAADVVLMNDNLMKLSTAIRLSKHTLAIARQNIVFAIAVKVLVLLLATVGIATMWLAVFADVGVMVLCVLNAMRALRSS